MPKNNDPFKPWNGFHKDDPFAPWNGWNKDNPFACWNNPFGNGDCEDEVDEYMEGRS